MKTFKKILTTLCLALVFCLTTVSLAACDKKKDPVDPPPQDPSTQTPAGNYWDDDPDATLIGTYDELKQFITTFRSKDYIRNFPKDENRYVVITSDIDCKGEALNPLISTDYKGVGFKIDGAGHKIHNFKIDKATNLVDAAAATGSNLGSFVTLSLFPMFEGGTLENIEFKDFSITGEFGANENNNIYVGLIGYSRSSGSNVPIDDDHPNDYASTGKLSSYKNVKLTNMKVDLTMNGKTSDQVDTFVFSIGTLMGLDSDNTNTGEKLNSTTSTTIRENITVSGLDVKLNKTSSGTAFIGGISGQTHWMLGQYKNCVVSGKVEVTSAGTDVQDCKHRTTDLQLPKYQWGHGGEAVALGDAICIGGIIGGQIKLNHEIKIEGGSSNLEIVANVQENLLHVGNAVGLYSHDKSSAPDFLSQTDYSSLTVNSAFVGSSTLKVNDGAKANVSTNVNTVE